MQIAFEVYPEQQLVRLRLGDTVSPEDVRDYLARRDADPRFEPRFRRLIDARELVSFPSAAAMRTITDLFVAGNPQRAPLAVVAGSDALFGLFRILEIVSELQGYNHRVFRTLEEAEEWLGLGRSSGSGKDPREEGARGAG